MRTEPVDIYSDKTNAAVMRHPGRHFPGVLIQGDSLSILCQVADDAGKKIGRGNPGFEDANSVRKALQGYLVRYKVVLLEHGMRLPFSEQISPD